MLLCCLCVVRLCACSVYLFLSVYLVICMLIHVCSSSYRFLHLIVCSSFIHLLICCLLVHLFSVWWFYVAVPLSDCSSFTYLLVCLFIYRMLWLYHTPRSILVQPRQVGSRHPTLPDSPSPMSPLPTLTFQPLLAWGHVLSAKCAREALRSTFSNSDSLEARSSTKQHSSGNLRSVESGWFLDKGKKVALHGLYHQGYHSDLSITHCYLKLFWAFIASIGALSWFGWFIDWTYWWRMGPTKQLSDPWPPLHSIRARVQWEQLILQRHCVHQSDTIPENGMEPSNATCKPLGFYSEV